MSGADATRYVRSVDGRSTSPSPSVGMGSRRSGDGVRGGAGSIHLRTSGSMSFSTAPRCGRSSRTSSWPPFWTAASTEGKERGREERERKEAKREELASVCSSD